MPYIRQVIHEQSQAKKKFGETAESQLEFSVEITSKIEEIEAVQNKSEQLPSNQNRWLPLWSLILCIVYIMNILTIIIGLITCTPSSTCLSSAHASSTTTAAIPLSQTTKCFTEADPHQPIPLLDGSIVH